MGKDMDYTRSQKNTNSNWILLAQKLSGAGLIARNYYLFLMPTLKSDVDIVSRESTVKLSLDNCILDENGQELIYLPHCVLHLKYHGTFYVNGSPPRPFTQLEQQRLSFNPTFSKYRKAFIQEKVPPLSLETVLAIWALVNKALYPDGLLFFHNYSSEQLSQAEHAFEHFFISFYEKMNPEDRKNLDEHIIIFNGRKKTFSSILNEIQTDKCVAISSQWLAQLVIDYAPWISFNDKIEKKASINEMRVASQKRSIRNDNFLIRQLQMVYISLLTHQFPESSVLISAFGFEKVCFPFLNPASGWAILRMASMGSLASKITKLAGAPILISVCIANNLAALEVII
jgi:hypothetical protein